MTASSIRLLIHLSSLHLHMEQKPSGHGVIFANGYLAGQRGELHTGNPHEDRSMKAAAWRDGWNEGSTRRAWMENSNRLDAPFR